MRTDPDPVRMSDENDNVGPVPTLDYQGVAAQADPEAPLSLEKMHGSRAMRSALGGIAMILVGAILQSKALPSEAVHAAGTFFIAWGIVLLLSGFIWAIVGMRTLQRGQWWLSLCALVLDIIVMALLAWAMVVGETFRW